MELFARLLLAHRRAAAAVAIAAAVLSGFALRGLELDLSLAPILVANEDAERRVEEFHARVPPRAFDTLVVLSWPREVDRSALATLEEVTAEVEAREGVESVVSLANAPVVPRGAPLPLPVPFPRALPEGSSVREEVRRHPLLERRLLSRDGRAALLAVTFTVPHDAPRRAADVGERTDALVADLRARLDGVAVTAVGGAIVERSLSRFMTHDLTRTLLLELLAAAVLLPLLLRTVRGTVLPLAVVLLAVAASLGLLAALGRTLSILDLAIPGLITIIGLCDAVHLMHRFEAELSSGLARDAALRRALERVGLACLQTSLTTGLGFLSLLVSDHDAVRAFGWKASLSVAVTFVTVVIVLPLALSAWPIRRAAAPPRLAPRFLRVGRPAKPLLAAAAVLALSLAGATRVVVDSRWLEELPPDAPEVLALQEYERRFQGILWFEMSLEGELDQPAVLRALEEFERDLSSLEDLDGIESITQWIAEVAGHPDHPERLDDAARSRAVLALKLAGDAFPAHLVDETFRHGRVLFRTGDIGTRRFLELTEAVEARAAALPAAVRASVEGPMRLAHESSRLVVTTMLESFLLSFAAITLLVTITYRSLRLGLVSMVPNVLPIAVALGVNGWLGIPLRIGIVMIYALGLGLAVDDTIHLLTRYAQERSARPGISPREALDAALQHTGRALVVTSLLLLVGCLCYLPAEFRSMRDVGLLLNAVVVAALLADLFVLPHLVLLVDRDRRES